MPGVHNKINLTGGKARRLLIFAVGHYWEYSYDE